MKLWLDAQLPPALADYIRLQYNIEAFPLRDMALRDASDQENFVAARQANIILISKDVDFVELVQRLGPPPQLLWVTCGNVSNTNLCNIFANTWDAIIDLLLAGEPIVEVADKNS